MNEKAGNAAFQHLSGFIAGNNRERAKIAMTAPVGQSPAGRKIEMTATVSQWRAENRWAISFMMPASFTLETLPVPNDPRIEIVPVKARRMAAIRYSGRWTQAGFEKNLKKLETWMASRSLAASGPAVWARYNPPITPWFLRRNEILIPISRQDVTE